MAGGGVAETLGGELVYHSPGRFGRALRRLRTRLGGIIAGCTILDVCPQGLEVRIQSAGIAPGDKCLRVDFDRDDETTSSLEAALLILGDFAPTIVIPGQLGRIEHDFKNARIFLFSEPRDA